MSKSVTWVQPTVLGLVADNTPSQTVAPAEAIPFALDPPEVETLGYDADAE